jgi:hypothetical protein
MYEKRIQIESGQTLTLVEMGHNLVVTAWDKPDVLILLREGERADLVVEETESGPAVSAQVACKVQLPANVPVVIRQALGNLRVGGIADLNAEQVRGNLKLDEASEAVVAEVYGNLKVGATTSLRVVGTVYGDAYLKAVQDADLQNVRGNLVARGSVRLRASRISGNLRAKEVTGTLDADRVGGNALLKGIGGAVTLDQVAGNFVGKHLTGGAKVPKIGGNVVLNGELGTGCTYHFDARGNAVLGLSEESSAHLSLSARGRITSALELADQEGEGGRLSGTLGDGGAEIVVEAGGNVSLGRGGTVLRVEIGDDFSRQVEESLQAVDLEAIGRQVNEEMEAAMSRLQVKLEGMDWERIGLQSQRAVERAMEKMQRNMDRLVEKAARQQDRMARKAARTARRLERVELRQQRAERRQQAGQAEVSDWSDQEAAEPVEPEPDLDEERLSILRMVERGQITPEDAEMLLDALQ